VVLTALTNLFFILLFLFIFWRKIKEDYVAERIFSTAFFAIVALIVVSLFTTYYYPRWWFWGAFAGVFVGVFVGVKRFRMRFFELVDAMVIAMLPWTAGIFLLDAMQNKEILSLVASIFIIFLVFTYVIIDKHYKRFLWYRSGRVGFTGMTVLGLFFTVRAAVAAYVPGMLTLVGFYDVIVSGVVAFLAFSSVIILARE
jgi:hypothetical protein